MGSRGSRTYDQNAGKPMEQSTAPKPPAATPPPTTASPAPTAQSNPSLFQRHPILTGIAAGIAGSWIRHMLFGATDSTAKTGEDGRPARRAIERIQHRGYAPSYGRGRRRALLLFAPAQARACVRRDDPGNGRPGSLLDSYSTGSFSGSSSAAPFRTATVDSEITAEDKAAFQQLLIDIQSAWSKQDLAALRRFVTPEMLAYFSTALAGQASQEVENHVEDVVLAKADLEES